MTTQQVAHSIIDLVESRLRELFPDIEIMASEMEGNTLLHGENYYDLENDVVAEIQGLEVHVVIGVWQGIFDSLGVFTTKEKADTFERALCERYEVPFETEARNKYYEEHQAKGDINRFVVEVDPSNVTP